MDQKQTSAVPVETLRQLATQLAGELHYDALLRQLYATDASEYQELPLAVAFPKSEPDLRHLLAFADRHGVGLIPRGAGTSLAGQVVGSGLVVDVGRYLNRIIDYEPGQQRVRVQPGVVRNELNLYLKPYGVFFAPETSTANRAMIGGMVGNNSCGANSIVYGATCDHLVSARGFLGDGALVTFGPLSPAEFAAKCDGPDTAETRIYREIRDLLSSPANRQLIRDNFPKPSVSRRNTGYGLDRLIDCAVFDPGSEKPFNLCRLIAGSAGTLFLGVEFELKCEPLPPSGALMCAHFASVPDALKATVIAMRHRPHGCELIDRLVLECTKNNPELTKNRDFVVGDPAGVLVIEFRHHDQQQIERELQSLEAELRAEGLGYAFPRRWGQDGNRVWELRRAGQGLMTNVRGDAKPHTFVEDTAVAVEDLPNYIAEFDVLMKDKYGLDCIYYAHAGAGELHNRPLFDLKSAKGLAMFRAIGTDVARLVKKYRGSLSGEHGDGRARGEFIPLMVGNECYAMMRRIKTAFDPRHRLNPGKIIDPVPMDQNLRHQLGVAEPQYKTLFDFAATEGIVRTTEKCSGAGECRKSHLVGGTMCPSYMATRNEKDTTRARANMLREVLTHPRDLKNPWDSAEVKEVMDLCLSCKGCKSECPSNVDVARLKAEWQQHYNDTHGIPFRSRVIANFSTSMRLAARVPRLYNWAVQSPTVSGLIKRISGFSEQRTLPTLPAITVRAWHGRHANPSTQPYPNGRVFFFCDEFTNYTDASVGIRAIELLNGLGYDVVLPPQVDSGRAQFSKGLVRQGQALALRNVELLADLVTEGQPLVGIEPSAILSFRDEYPDLVPSPLKAAAQRLAKNALLIDEFIAREAKAGRIRSDQFTHRPQAIKLHGHCHQKALSSLTATVKMLELPVNFKVQLIPSGCCGMAGSFGYEKEHFAVSQQIGELVLFPAVRATDAQTLIAAPGTSCRHQIRDGTGRASFHPVEILRSALRE